MTIVLVLAADRSHDDLDSGYPLCLAEVNGKPLLQHVVEQCAGISDLKLVLAAQESDCKRWHLDNVLTQLSPSGTVIRVQKPTAGAACTALLGINIIDADEPLLILNGNELIDIDFSVPIAAFQQQDCDAGVIVFSSVHPRYSYVRTAAGRVVEAAEKNPISTNATVGFYWFKNAKDFVAAAQSSIRKNAHVDGKFYICPTLNEMVLKQANIATYSIDASRFHPMKSERQIDRFEVWKASTS